MYPILEDEQGNLIYEDGVEPIAARTSERTNFKKCRRLWKYTSQNQLSLEPIRLNHNLLFGICIHVGLEARYDPERWGILSDQAKTDISVAAFESELQKYKTLETKHGMPEERRQMYDDFLDLGRGMLRNYGKWAPEQDKEIGLVPLAVEKKFQVPIFESTDSPLVVGDRPVVYQIRLDMLAYHEATDDYWIWDHKTASNVSRDTNFLDLDVQLASYAWAYQVKHGVPIAGIVYNELAKSVPHPPKVNQNGAISQDKRQNTTYELYQEKIDELGLDPAPYSAMLDFLALKGEKHFRRTPIVKTQREIYNQGIYVLQETSEMVSPDLPLYPNPSEWNCGGCDFQVPCRVENEGNDVDFILSDPSMFRPRSGESPADAA